MAIITSTLIRIRPQADGTTKATEDHVDHLGRHWYFRVRGPDEATLTTAMNARDLIEQLRDREKLDAKNWIRGGGDPDDFRNGNVPAGEPSRVDLTIPGYETYLMRQFATQRWRDDENYFENVALWIAGKNATGGAASIANRLGVSVARANTIKDRAVHLRDVTNPAMILDDADIDEDID